MVLMKRKGEVLQPVKQFAKEVGAPDMIISGMAREQLSQEVKHFCNLIGMMLCALWRAPLGQTVQNYTLN